MKGAKGSKRDRIISFLFSKKNKKLNEIKLEEEQKKPTISPTTVTNNKTKTAPKKDEENINVILDLDEEIITEKEKIEITNTPSSDNSQEKEIVVTKEPIINEANITPDIVQIEQEEEIFEEEDIEKIILETIETIVKEDLYELEQLQYELKVLNDKQEEVVLTDETENLKQQLQEIIEKFEKLKNKYYPKNKISEIVDIYDNYIYDLIKEYKDDLKDSQIISNMQEEIEQIKDYISIMDQIIHVENQTEEIDKNIDDKLDEFEIRDEDFEIMKDEYQDIEQIKKIIEEFNKNQDSLLRDLEDKVKYSEEITKKVETDVNIVTNLSRLLEAAILIAMSKKIPPTPRGKLIKVGMIIAAVDAATKFVTTKETKREITTVKYTDFSKNIFSALKDISNISNKIDESFVNIETIRQKLKTEYGEYSGTLDAFDELMNNLDNVEKELKTQKDHVVKYHNDFKNILDKNNAKVKKLEEIKN